MIPGSANPLLLKSAAAAAGGYQIERSLRFNSSDSAYCSRTPAVAGNRRTFTFSCWLKKSGVDSSRRYILFSTYSSGSVYFTLEFETNILKVFDGGSISSGLSTSAVFRDPSAWYHVVLSIDTTQATASNRVKLYVNGTEQTLSGTQPAQNADLNINAAVPHRIGALDTGTIYHVLDGYLAEVFFIDGQQLTPSSFTEVSATTGQLIPKAYGGTFGTNGFWLKFSDNSAATAATLGKDYSGNGNNWTPNNLSVTAGAGNDSLVDTPTSISATDTGVGGEIRGNYATLNPLDNSSGMTLANGNLDGSETGGGHKGTRATIKFPSSGKWYYEGTVTTLGGACCIGAATNAAANPDINASGSYYILVNSSGNVQRYQSFASYTGFDTPAVGTILRVAYDADAQKLWLGLNALWMNGSNGTTGNPATGANATFSSITDIYPAIDQQTSAVAVNFGQRAFAYTAPSGFKALCDTNLGAPLVAKPNTLMDAVLYTGNGGTQTISSLAFSPDFVWLKSRSNAYGHQLYDVVRGAGYLLGSNSTSAESGPFSDVLNAFTSNGFTVGSDTGINGSGNSVVGWTWDAGTSTVSNTAGSITSQVRANVSAGFSVVGWTSNGTSGIETTGHGLGVSPDLIIVKNRDASSPWQVFHSSFSNTASDYLFLNTTDAKVTSGATIWTRSSTTFGYRQSSIFTNGQKGIAYCFAPVVGYSSVSSYVGNGSSDGPFVYTGMRPRWILTKRYDGGSNGWGIFDALRPGYNLTDSFLQPQSAGSESTGATAYSIDILSNGFKVKGTDAFVNQSAGTYIYAAFAENPFQYARAR